ncbi:MULTISPECIES: PIG-L family deacetylase [Microbacterium]|uniref:PIG-L family deacetylase n=1 Tax=Microbacterium TaxID=33882 RepID=UPI0027820069|nr:MULTISPECIES: PIG-L family deacetylase [Microbacterium]MDQ1083227.1 LmbE family N-acetylglucosaminyl deacetylase [Microbacterium sp. SORGH_AS_0344]MDQ1171495.1 LmbE family N-acetylglucosaminyl deacetylase [Microbacterium proteolyticum]
MTATKPTIAGIWAHYDDDLLFATPTIDHAIRQGSRVRNLFLTASDAGTGLSPYVEGRENGIRAAYDVMRGSSSPWSDRETVLSNGVAVTTTSPDDDPRISLAFLRLPDGGLTGRGWFATGYATMPKLLDAQIPSMKTLDTGQEITARQLIDAVAAFIAESAATEVLATLPDFAPGSDGDHPDHGVGGRVVAAAVDAGLVDSAIVRYAIGYPVSAQPVNLAPAAVARKLDVFAAYGEHDAVLRRDPQDYLALDGVRDWLRREHLIADRDVARPHRS